MASQADLKFKASLEGTEQIVAGSNKIKRHFQEINKSSKNVSAGLGKMAGSLKGVGAYLAPLVGVTLTVTHSWEQLNKVSQTVSDNLDIFKNQIKAVDTAFWSVVSQGGSIATFIQRLDEITEAAKNAATAADAAASAKIFSKTQGDYLLSQANTFKAMADAEEDAAKKAKLLAKAQAYLRGANRSMGYYSDKQQDSSLADLNSRIINANTYGFDFSGLKSQHIDALVNGYYSEADMDRMASKWKGKFEELEKYRPQARKGSASSIGFLGTTYKGDKEKYEQLRNEMNNYFKSHPLELVAVLRAQSNDVEEGIGVAMASYVESSNISRQLEQANKKISKSMSPISEYKPESSVFPTTTAVEEEVDNWEELTSYMYQDIAYLDHYTKLMDTLFQKEKQIEELQVWEQQQQKIDDVNNTIGLMNASAGSLGSILSATGDSGAAAFANLLTSVVPLIGAIMTLTVAEGEEKAARSSKNWIELIAAIGAVTGAIVGTFAANKNIGRAADGAIVGGNNFSGDSQLYRVNSGEMILNKVQQASLFRLLDFGGNNSVNANTVEFKLKGTDLVGLMKNTTKKNNKLL